MGVFLDGNLNYPSCRCKPSCEMPCWQLVGLTDQPCGACGCAPFDYKQALINVPEGSPIPEGYVKA